MFTLEVLATVYGHSKYYKDMTKNIEDYLNWFIEKFNNLNDLCKFTLLIQCKKSETYQNTKYLRDILIFYFRNILSSLFQAEYQQKKIFPKFG